MRRILYLIAALVLVGAVACKTTEANYRSAYEIAKKKATDTGDTLTTRQLTMSLLPKTLIFGTDSVPVVTEVVAVTKTEKSDGRHLKKYCIVAGRFAQLFNASSMRDRLMSEGYPEAFLAHNRMNQYYVITGVTNIPSEAVTMLDSLRADTTLVFRPPFPYVLRPAQYVR